MPSEGGSNLILGVFFDTGDIFKIKVKVIFIKNAKAKKNKKFKFSKSYLTFLGSSWLEPKSSNFDPTLARFLSQA